MTNLIYRVLLTYALGRGLLKAPWYKPKPMTLKNFDELLKVFYITPFREWRNKGVLPELYQPRPEE